MVAYLEVCEVRGFLSPEGCWAASVTIRLFFQKIGVLHITDCPSGLWDLTQADVTFSFWERVQRAETVQGLQTWEHLPGQWTASLCLPCGSHGITLVWERHDRRRFRHRSLTASSMTPPLTEVQWSESGAWNLGLALPAAKWRWVLVLWDYSKSWGRVNIKKLYLGCGASSLGPFVFCLWVTVLYSVKYMVTCWAGDGAWLPGRPPCENRKLNHKL